MPLSCFMVYGRQRLLRDIKEQEPVLRIYPSCDGNYRAAPRAGHPAKSLAGCLNRRGNGS